MNWNNEGREIEYPWDAYPQDKYMVQCNYEGKRKVVFYSYATASSIKPNRHTVAIWRTKKKRNNNEA